MNSRVSLKVRFDPYRADQLEEILRVRLQKKYERLFEEGALKYIATSVATTSGDVRRCVQAARKALFVAEDEFHKNNPKVDVYDTIASTVIVLRC